ncbi:MAG TPA: protein kinase family protein [Pirellulales bacterium]|nr:protein kinase family protein [Pirellulales bacterium]
MSSPEGRENQRKPHDPAAEAAATLPQSNDDRGPISPDTGNPADTGDQATLPPRGSGWQGDSTVHWSDKDAANQELDSAHAPAGGVLPEVPGYQVLRFVARGGMGVVLEARHVVLDRLVAIKRISAQAGLEQPMAGYVFRLAAMDRSPPDAAEQSTQRAPFALARRGVAVFRMEILREGVPLASQELSAAEWDEEALRLFASRQGDRLIFRVDKLALQRTVEVESLLRSEGDPYWGPRWSLLRGYHVAGRYDDAIRLAEEMLGDFEPAQVGLTGLLWVDEYTWLECLRGEPEKARDRLDKLLVPRPGVDDKPYRWLLFARARVHAALGQWQAAESDLDELFAGPPDAIPSSIRPMASLALGLLRERRGDLPGARTAWKEGLLTDGSQRSNGSSLLANLILSSLIGEVTDAEAERLMTSLFALFAEASPLAALGNAARLPPTVIREMWRTPRGHAAAWKIAFHEVSLGDFSRLAAVVMGSETARQVAFGGQVTPEQETLVWDLTDDFYTAFMSGKISHTQALQCVMSWKGIMNFAGWGGLAPTLRGPMAYVLGRRRLQLPPPAQRADAARFFRTAVDDSAPLSLLRRLAETELKGLGYRCY